MKKIIYVENMRMTFGKHKGEFIEDTITEDPEWVQWAISEKIFELDNDLLLMLENKEN